MFRCGVCGFALSSRLVRWVHRLLVHNGWTELG